MFSRVAALLLALCGPALATYDNGLARTPPVGWSTWCTDNDIVPCYNDMCSQSEIESVVIALKANGLFSQAASPRYILLDDCWAAKERNNKTGAIQADSSRFPSGTLKPLADFVHARGMKLMAYTDAGKKTCRDGRTGSGGHYVQDANTFASWGLDGVKMDWCDHGSGTEKELYSEFSRALNKTGRPMLFYICGWGIQQPWEWAPAISNVWRAGPDHIPVYYLPPGSQDPGVGGGTWNVIQHMAGLSKYAAPGSFPTPDYLEPGYLWNSAADDRAEFTFWCLLGAPLMVATDVRDMKNKEHLFNTEALSINQDPLGSTGDIRLNNTNGRQVWSRRLSNGDYAVVLFNANLLYGDVENTLRLNGSYLPNWPSAKTSCKLRDIWAQKDLGTFKDGALPKFDQGPHDTQFLRVTPVA
jgi:alpha-galactosidase